MIISNTSMKHRGKDGRMNKVGEKLNLKSRQEKGIKSSIKKEGREGKEKNNEARRETPSVCGNKRVPQLSGRLNMNGTKQNEGFETLRVLAILLATVA